MGTCSYIHFSMSSESLPFFATQYLTTFDFLCITSFSLCLHCQPRLFLGSKGSTCIC
jgi:hypothetical protein